MIDDCIDKHKNTLFFTVVYKMIAFFQYCALVNFNWTNVGTNRPCSVCPIRNVFKGELTITMTMCNINYFTHRVQSAEKIIYSVM